MKNLHVQHVVFISKCCKPLPKCVYTIELLNCFNSESKIKINCPVMKKDQIVKWVNIFRVLTEMVIPFLYTHTHFLH